MSQPDALSRVANIVQRHINEDGFTGAAVIGARRGRILLEHYAGNAGPGLPSSESILWPIASISKMYAVSAIMRLIENGEITLNTLACNILPEFTGDGREEIRLRHLLTHTSGLIYESPEMEARLIAQTPIEDLIKEAMQAPLKFKPGSSLAYADYNTLVAGRMAEVVTGKSLPDLVRGPRVRADALARHILSNARRTGFSSRHRARRDGRRHDWRDVQLASRPRTGASSIRRDQHGPRFAAFRFALRPEWSTHSLERHGPSHDGKPDWCRHRHSPKHERV